MIENAENKGMASEPVETKQPEAPQVTSPKLNEFHFSGGGEFYPMTVHAETVDEAMAIFFTKRVPLKPE